MQGYTFDKNVKTDVSSEKTILLNLESVELKIVICKVNNSLDRLNIRMVMTKKI